MDVLFVRDIEKIVLSGVILSIRGAQHQGYDAQYLGGVMAQAEHTCIAAKGDWPALLDEARTLLLPNQQLLLDAALQIGSGN